jgi:hypothetical protein
MNALATPFKQLVDNKLWPLAVLLVAALVAVPMLLKKDPVTDSLPVATSVPGDSQGATKSVVSLSDAGKRDRVRAVLGDRKDPFRPAQFHHVAKSEDGLTTAGVETKVDVPTGGGTPTDVGGGLPTDPTVVTTPTPAPKIYELLSLTVRFGQTTGPLTTREVKRLTGLPGGTHPAALYLGPSDDHKSAVFVVDAGVEVLGDGTCDPTPENCQTLTMREGETVFLTRGAKQYELDLVKIHTSKTTDAAEAAESRTTVAKNGRKSLRKMAGRLGAWFYDSKTGTLRKKHKKPNQLDVTFGAR